MNYSKLQQIAEKNKRNEDATISCLQARIPSQLFLSKPARVASFFVLFLFYFEHVLIATVFMTNCFLSFLAVVCQENDVVKCFKCKRNRQDKRGLAGGGNLPRSDKSL